MGLLAERYVFLQDGTVQSISLSDVPPLLEPTEKTLAYNQQKCDNAEPSSNNSATSRNISGKTDNLGTLMHGHSKI